MMSSFRRYASACLPMDDRAWYGIEWDEGREIFTPKRIGNLMLHRRLPIQNAMRRVRLSDDGTEGEQGQAMVLIPTFYVKFESEGTIRRAMMSAEPLAGFTRWDKCYVAAYNAIANRRQGKLYSITADEVLAKSDKEDFRGGNNNASWDNTFRSQIGMPTTNMSFQEMQNWAKARGSGWEMYSYDVHKRLFWLAAIEFGDFDWQRALGKGWTTFKNGATFGYCGVVPCGASDKGTTYTKVVSADGKTETLPIAVYRGVEHVFGHIFQILSGVEKYADAGVLYFALNNNGYAVDFKNVGRVASILFGNEGDILPFQTMPDKNVQYFGKAFMDMRGIVGRYICVGGNSDLGWVGGLATFRNFDKPEVHIGTRLTFVPNK